MKLLIDGYRTNIRTKSRNNRLVAKAVITELDGMVISVSGSTEDDPDSLIDRVISKVKAEFSYMAAMAVGFKEDIS